jgi:hypothetical protein
MKNIPQMAGKSDDGFDGAFRGPVKRVHCLSKSQNHPTGLEK